MTPWRPPLLVLWSSPIRVILQKFATQQQLVAHARNFIISNRNRLQTWIDRKTFVQTFECSPKPRWPWNELQWSWIIKTQEASCHHARTFSQWAVVQVFKNGYIFYHQYCILEENDFGILWWRVISFWCSGTKCFGQKKWFGRQALASNTVQSLSLGFMLSFQSGETFFLTVLAFKCHCQLLGIFWGGFVSQQHWSATSFIKDWEPLQYWFSEHLCMMFLPTSLGNICPFPQRRIFNIIIQHCARYTSETLSKGSSHTKQLVSVFRVSACCASYAYILQQSWLYHSSADFFNFSGILASDRGNLH